MDVFQRNLSNNILSPVYLKRRGYSDDEIRAMRSHQFAGRTKGDDLGSLRKLMVLGYKDTECLRIWNELQNLLINYHCNIMIGNASLAPCSAWRAERILKRDDKIQRFAGMVHVFEKVGNGRPGRYIGYIMLRPINGGDNTSYTDSFPFTTVANLSAPRYLFRPRYHVVTCMAGGADGVLPFRAVPFCSPGRTDDNRARAVCIHAAIQEALLLTMNRFQCVPMSSVDMIATLWDHAHNDRVYKEKFLSPPTMRQAARHLIDLQDGLTFLLSETVNAGGNLQAFRVSDFGEDAAGKAALREHARRVMMDYLANGVPLVLATKARQNETTPIDNVDANDDPVRDRQPSDLNHAILVFGMHLFHHPFVKGGNQSVQAGNFSTDVVDTGDFELPDRFIVHDITSGPYTERTSNTLLDEAMDRDGLSFLAVMPKGSKCGVIELRRLSEYLFLEHMTTEEAEFLTTYRSRIYGSSAEGESQGGTDTPRHNESSVRYIIRLLSCQQVIARYLLNARGNSVVPQERLKRENDVNWFWAVEVRLIHELPTGLSDLGDAPPAMIMIWNIADELEGDAPEQPRIWFVYAGHRRKNPGERIKDMYLDKHERRLRGVYRNRA